MPAAWAAKFHNEPYDAELTTTGPNTCDLTVGPVDLRGLGEDNVTFVLSADAAIGLACKNRGENFPADPKKQAAAGAASEEATVEPKNGRIRESFTIDISDQEFAPALECPGSQVATLLCCQYTNIELEDTTNGLVAGVSPTSLALNLAGDLFNNDCTEK